jgi:hypothetical protein
MAPAIDSSSARSNWGANTVISFRAKALQHREVAVGVERVDGALASAPTEAGQDSAGEVEPVQGHDDCPFLLRVQRLHEPPRKSRLPSPGTTRQTQDDAASFWRQPPRPL